MTDRDKELLRQAGERLGALAEEARTRLELVSRRRPDTASYQRWAKLARLSRDVLEVVRDN